MRRGEKPLTAILTIESKPAGAKGKKGIYLENRNNLLACRFYYYFQLVGLRYDKCLEDLSDEFFLGENSIASILEKRQQFIKQLKEQKTDLRDLQRQYPKWRWN